MKKLIAYDSARFDRYYNWRLRRLLPGWPIALPSWEIDARAHLALYAHGCMGFSRFAPAPLPLP